MSMNTVRPWRDIYRRQSRKIRVGSVEVGGDAPITVQTMTNTLTSDAQATIAQVQACAEAGADIVRVSCPDKESTAALRQIVRSVDVPIVADIHFHYKRAIEAAEAGAASEEPIEAEVTEEAPFPGVDGGDEGQGVAPAAGTYPAMGRIKFNSMAIEAKLTKAEVAAKKRELFEADEHTVLEPEQYGRLAVEFGLVNR